MRLPSKRKRNFKVIFWGIGVRASYKTNYGEKTIWDKVRFYFMRKSDAVLFYSSDPIKRYLDEGFEREKLFVANNTVEVLPIQNLERKNLLFIGTLYQQKKIYVLLENYLTAYKENSKIPQLDIIGDGDEYDNILGWVKENGLANKIFLRGKIFDEKKLSHYFSQALACISPGQAGLSVLKSMGYGVPFITSESAITGGEIFNIENDASGILYENHDQLKEIILETVHNKAKYIEMGNRAKEHYHQYRRPKHMVRGMSEAIEYVLGNSY
ncbi:glycosyltransferase [Allomuricauda sp. SCSIO 65647]|uniref:glycosyltransferase n=1 Tax=Allomuricauda sp. SCSIO 65647 TaxID=2908843 RepID=UPI001F41A2B0|nr:glycosyltransferase [Muricauda sp. SCSIO 65647]UJH67023.1 glycosyltransferase [Muricauda sp. SCSIO 65647]